MLQQHSANKIFGLILTLVFVSIVGNPTKESVHAQSTGALENRMQEYMEEKLEKKVTSFKLSNLKFKEDKDPNVYITLFNELQIQAEQNALSNLRARGYGDDQIGDLQQGADVQQELTEAYEAELRFQEQLAKHENETLALEMFTNGSTRDGEFDLIDDLERIEDILFERRSESQLRDPSDGSNAGERFSQGLGRNTYGIRSEGRDRDSDDDSPVSVFDVVDPELTEIEGLVCQLDEELLDNLRDYEEDADGEAEEEPEEEDDDETEGEVGTGEGTGPPSEQGRKALGRFNPADERCDGKVFCFYSESISTTEYARPLEDNGCVACAIENIANTMNELLSESVAPNKVTGNFLEPNMCKNSFGLTKIDLKITLIERPIFSSDGVPAVTELDANDLQEERSELSTVSTDSNQQETLDEATQAALALAATGDAVALANRTADLRAQIELETRIREGLFPVSQDMQSQSELIQSLDQRMQTMNVYFDSYKDMLDRIQRSLTAISQKEICQ